MSDLDLVWVFLCTALVFMMQVGFMCVEAGITRTKNNISVALKNIADISLSFILFWLIGYGLMFGPSAAGLIGIGGIANVSSGSEDLARFAFQAVFAGTAATILSGAVAERCSFHGYLILTALTAVLIYPVFGHWAWATDAGGVAIGWLGALGFRDFAGSGVVHALGGCIALAAVLVLGPREGRFLSGGGSRRFNGSDLPMTMLGVFLLWIGWFGFNSGSTLGFDERVPAIFVNTLAGGAAGVLGGMALSWYMSGRPNVFFTMNGGLGGLVAVTAGCDLFSLGQSIFAGAVASAIVLWGDRLLERSRIDDVVGAVPVHLFCGIWGLVAASLFGTGLVGLPVQLLGAAVLVIWAFGASYLIIRLIDHFLPLRVSQHIETIGLNVGEHDANTDINELFEVMQRQARDRDLSMRVPQSPFTEIGQIGIFYNSVMYELERSFNRMEDQARALEEAVAQREALLESILPKSVAIRMNDGEKQIVDQFADATVVFIDLVDFTVLCMNQSPQESLTLLRKLFGEYDKVVSRFGLEKIKTIGDCYMFVSGVPNPEPDHCSAAVDAALEILFATRQVGTSIGREVKVRIGIHSGPLIAGVVGDLRFVYDLWGSTVNTAARIEEAAQPDKITVSEAVIDRIGSDFIYHRQGRVRLRSIGPMILYSIEGRRQNIREKSGATANRRDWTGT